MNRLNKVTIRTRLIVGYSDILHKARKGVKALRLPHLAPIMLLGDNGEGLRASDIGKLTGSTITAVCHKYNRVIKAGYIYKQDKRYFLTPSGHSVYSTICREFDVLVKEITRAIVEECIPSRHLDR